MDKGSKLLLAGVTLLCTLALGVYVRFMFDNLFRVNVAALRAVNEAAKATPVPTASPEATATATGSATPKGKVSASPVVKATAKATEAPEATVEATPAQ